MPRLILLHKPYLVLCQFTDPAGRPTLAELLPVAGVYPAGRLDHDSEGLVVLTDEGELQHRIADPRHKLPKTYWAQVEGVPDDAALGRLREGVELRDGRTRPARVRLLGDPAVWPRDPPIRERRHIPTTWLELVLTEGRNRQVRRMTAAVGFPTLRLIRTAVGPWGLGDLRPGQWREEAWAGGPGGPAAGGGTRPLAPAARLGQDGGPPGRRRGPRRGGGAPCPSTRRSGG